jgi:ABC-type glycerol-3-phosphate transport system substrate-binding protein
MPHASKGSGDESTDSSSTINRRAYLAAAGVSIAGLTAGCGGGGGGDGNGGGGDGNGGGGDGNGGGATAGNGNGGTIEITMLSDRNSPPEQEALRGAFDSWAETRDENLERSFQFASFDEATTRLNTMVASGNPPDVCYMGWGGLALLTAGGVFQNVSGYVNDNMDVPGPLLENISYNDQITVIPSQWDLNVQWYRQDLFDEAGITPADDYEGQLANMEQLADVVPDGMQPLNVPANSNSSMTYQMNMAYEASNDAYIMRRSSLDEPPEVIADQDPWRSRLIETYSHLNELYTNYSPETINQDWGSTIQVYVTERAAQTQYPGRLLNQVQNDNPDLMDVTSFSTYPVGPSGDGFQGKTFLAGFAVPQDTGTSDMALDFANHFLQSDSYVDMLLAVPLNALPVNFEIFDNDTYQSNEIVQANQDYVEFAQTALEEYNWFDYPDYPTMPEGGGALVPYQRNLVDGGNRMPTMAAAAITGQTPVPEAVDRAAQQLRDAIPQFENRVDTLQEQFS